MMNRRTLLWGLGLLLAAPVAFEAQQAGKVYRVLLFFVGDRQATPYAVLLRERLATRDTARDTRSCSRSALYTAIRRPAKADGREPVGAVAVGQAAKRAVRIDPERKLALPVGADLRIGNEERLHDTLVLLGLE